MSLYNMLFGQNEMADVILATLGLTKKDCGRFRDCFISDGRIAVYTRNGGGNRDCWHEDDGGNEDCVHEARVESVDETIETTEDEAKLHPEWKLLNVFIGANGRMAKTGKKVDKTFYKCLHPDSADCSCPGCIITYRLPKHPLYIKSRDDDYDSTYATIYFKFPEEYAEDLAKLDTGDEFAPSQRWLDMLDKISKEGVK